MAREVVIKGHTFKSILMDGQRYVLEREVAPYIKGSARTVRRDLPVQQAKDAIKPCANDDCPANWIAHGCTSFKHDERLFEHHVTESEIPNLLDNFRIVLQGWAHCVEKNDAISIHHIKQMSDYFKDRTGIDLNLSTKFGTL